MSQNTRASAPRGFVSSNQVDEQLKVSSLFQQNSFRAKKAQQQNILLQKQQLSQQLPIYSSSVGRREASPMSNHSRGEDASQKQYSIFARREEEDNQIQKQLHVSVSQHQQQQQLLQSQSQLPLYRTNIQQSNDEPSLQEMISSNYQKNNNYPHQSPVVVRQQTSPTTYPQTMEQQQLQQQQYQQMQQLQYYQQQQPNITSSFSNHPNFTQQAQIPINQNPIMFQPFQAQKIEGDTQSSANSSSSSSEHIQAQYQQGLRGNQVVQGSSFRLGQQVNHSPSNYFYQGGLQQTTPQFSSSVRSLKSSDIQNRQTNESMNQNNMQTQHNSFYSKPSTPKSRFQREQQLQQQFQEEGKPRKQMQIQIGQDINLIQKEQQFYTPRESTQQQQQFFSDFYKQQSNWQVHPSQQQASFGSPSQIAPSEMESNRHFSKADLATPEMDNKKLKKIQTQHSPKRNSNQNMTFSQATDQHGDISYMSQANPFSSPNPNFKISSIKQIFQTNQDNRKQSASSSSNKSSSSKVIKLVEYLSQRGEIFQACDELLSYCNQELEQPFLNLSSLSSQDSSKLFFYVSHFHLLLSTATSNSPLPGSAFSDEPLVFQSNDPFNNPFRINILHQQEQQVQSEILSQKSIRSDSNAREDEHNNASQKYNVTFLREQSYILEQFMEEFIFQGSSCSNFQLSTNKQQPSSQQQQQQLQFTQTEQQEWKWRYLNGVGISNMRSGQFSLACQQFQLLGECIDQNDLYNRVSSSALNNCAISALLLGDYQIAQKLLSKSVIQSEAQFFPFIQSISKKLLSKDQRFLSELPVLLFGYIYAQLLQKNEWIDNKNNLADQKYNIEEQEEDNQEEKQERVKDQKIQKAGFIKNAIAISKKYFGLSHAITEKVIKIDNLIQTYENSITQISKQNNNQVPINQQVNFLNKPIKSKSRVLQIQLILDILHESGIQLEKQQISKQYVFNQLQYSIMPTQQSSSSSATTTKQITKKVFSNSFKISKNNNNNTTNSPNAIISPSSNNSTSGWNPNQDSTIKSGYAQTVLNSTRVSTEPSALFKKANQAKDNQNPEIEQSPYLNSFQKQNKPESMLMINNKLNKNISLGNRNTGYKNIMGHRKNSTSQNVIQQQQSVLQRKLRPSENEIERQLYHNRSEEPRYFNNQRDNNDQEDEEQGEEDQPNNQEELQQELLTSQLNNNENNNSMNNDNNKISKNNNYKKSDSNIPHRIQSEYFPNQQTAQLVQVQSNPQISLPQQQQQDKYAQNQEESIRIMMSKLLTSTEQMNADKQNNLNNKNNNEEILQLRSMLNNLAEQQRSSSMQLQQQQQKFVEQQLLKLKSIEQISLQQTSSSQKLNQNKVRRQSEPQQEEQLGLNQILNMVTQQQNASFQLQKQQNINNQLYLFTSKLQKSGQLELSAIQYTTKNVLAKEVLTKEQLKTLLLKINYHSTLPATFSLNMCQSVYLLNKYFIMPFLSFDPSNNVFHFLSTLLLFFLKELNILSSSRGLLESPQEKIIMKEKMHWFLLHIEGNTFRIVIANREKGGIIKLDLEMDEGSQKKWFDWLGENEYQQEEIDNLLKSTKESDEQKNELFKEMQQRVLIAPSQSNDSVDPYKILSQSGSNNNGYEMRGYKIKQENMIIKEVNEILEVLEDMLTSNLLNFQDIQSFISSHHFVRVKIWSLALKKQISISIIQNNSSSNNNNSPQKKFMISSINNNTEESIKVVLKNVHMTFSPGGNKIREQGQSNVSLAQIKQVYGLNYETLHKSEKSALLSQMNDFFSLNVHEKNDESLLKQKQNSQQQENSIIKQPLISTCQIRILTSIDNFKNNNLQDNNNNNYSTQNNFISNQQYLYPLSMEIIGSANRLLGIKVMLYDQEICEERGILFSVDEQHWEFKNKVLTKNSYHLYLESLQLSQYILCHILEHIIKPIVMQYITIERDTSNHLCIKLNRGLLANKSTSIYRLENILSNHHIAQYYQSLHKSSHQQ